MATIPTRPISVSTSTSSAPQTESTLDMHDPILTPITDHDAALARAEEGIAELAKQRNNRWYPMFHIASNGGWINDPNGLCYVNNRWHVFYQLHPFGTQWGPMHWGHVSSSDLVQWRREPVALAPSLEQEKHGVFSGSAAIDDEGNVKIYYTGHRWANNRDNTGGDWQVQMLAEPNDEELTSFTKRGMIIDCPTDQVDHHFRDPKVWKTGDTWYLIIGVSSVDHRGQIWMYTSKDMVHWQFERVLFEHPDPSVFMLECPDFFPLTHANGEEKWVLGFSAMGAQPCGFMNRNLHNAGYLIGSWHPGEAFTPETTFKLWDNGHNFYAPQSFHAQNRQLMFGWMSPFVEPIGMDNDGWCGNLTLPREITLDGNNELRIMPAHEIEALRTTQNNYDEISVGTNEESVIIADAQAAEIILSIDLTATTAERSGLHVHATNDGHYTAIVYDVQTHSVIIDRQNVAYGDKGYRAIPLSARELQSGILRLRVFIDRGCVEVYINDGAHVMSSYSLPGEGERAVRLVAESGMMRVRDVQIYELTDIGLSEDIN